MVVIKLVVKEPSENLKSKTTLPHNTSADKKKLDEVIVIGMCSNGCCCHGVAVENEEFL